MRSIHSQKHQNWSFAADPEGSPVTPGQLQAVQPAVEATAVLAVSSRQSSSEGRMPVCPSAPQRPRPSFALLPAQELPCFLQNTTASLA